MVMDIAWVLPPQDIVSSDNVPAKVSAVVHLRMTASNFVMDRVTDYLNTSGQWAQAVLCMVLGRNRLERILGDSVALSNDIQRALAARTSAWGVQVSQVEIRQVDCVAPAVATRLAETAS